MKTMATMEAVCSSPEENEHWSQQWRQTPPVLIKKPVADLKKDLQNYEAERKRPKSQKRVHAGHGQQTKWEIPN
jgi:hypothetical protein